ncbi:aspartic peptidase domain-containing protein [Apodospora peruviana]|uniref:Aspartic peptidase domain-containing protein n=1 Tax=Apodospora peruviana TaxID=516989 RepID=A0AAE0HYV0_9PEZI|nr:aspartic peptidase domain-containing protein [Apodospora peruviana]
MVSPLVFSLFLFLLSLVHADAGSFAVKAKYNTGYAPNAARSYLRALQKWGGDVPKGLYQVAAIKDEGSQDAIPTKHDREYLSHITFGTPAQSLLMDLDTGSSDVWVFSSETSDDDNGNRSHYYPEQSMTALQIPNATWEISYGDGSAAGGNVWLDLVSIAGVEIQNATVESATYVSEELSDDPIMSGVFGLAYNYTPKMRPVMPSVLSRLSPLLNTSLFTVDLKWHADSEYEFGFLNSSKHIEPIHFVPLMDGAKYWELSFTKFNAANSKLWYLFNWPAIVDTGTTLLLLPTYIVERYYKQVTGAYESPMGWKYPCKSELPDFTIGFASNYTVTVPGKYINYLAFNDSKDSCLGGIQDNGGIEFSILGDIFLKAVFAVFDIRGGQVGFAKKELN